MSEKPDSKTEKNEQEVTPSETPAPTPSAAPATNTTPGPKREQAEDSEGPAPFSTSSSSSSDDFIPEEPLLIKYTKGIAGKTREILVCSAEVLTKVLQTKPHAPQCEIVQVLLASSTRYSGKHVHIFDPKDLSDGADEGLVQLHPSPGRHNLLQEIAEQSPERPKKRSANTTAARPSLGMRRSEQSQLNPQQSKQSHQNTQQSEQRHLNTQQSKQSHLNIQQSEQSHLNTQQSEQSHLSTQQSKQSHLKTQQSEQSHLNTQQSEQSHLNTQQSEQSHLNTQQSEQSQLNIQQSEQSHLNTQQLEPPRDGVEQFEVSSDSCPQTAVLKKKKLKIRSCRRSKSRTALKRVDTQRIVSSVFGNFFHFYALLGGHLKSGSVITKSSSNHWLKEAGVAKDAGSREAASNLFMAMAGTKVVLNIFDYLQFLIAFARSKQIAVTDLVTQLTVCKLPANESPVRKRRKRPTKVSSNTVEQERMLAHRERWFQSLPNL